MSLPHTFGTGQITGFDQCLKAAADNFTGIPRALRDGPLALKQGTACLMIGHRHSEQQQTASLETEAFRHHSVIYEKAGHNLT